MGKEPTEFDEKQAARILGVSIKTLQRWRRAGMIGYHRFGRRIRYTIDQLVTFRAACRVDPLPVPTSNRMSPSG